MAEETKRVEVQHGFHHEQATPSAKFNKSAATVTMVFPRRVVLTLDNHQRIEYQPGPQEVLVELVEPELHFYLEHNGVTRYVPVAPVIQGEAVEPVREAEVAEEVTEATKEAQPRRTSRRRG